MTSSESGYFWTKQTLVPGDMAPKGYESPAGGTIGISGICHDVLIKSPSFISEVAICHRSLSLYPVNAEITCFHG